MEKVDNEDQTSAKDHFCHGLDKGSPLFNCFGIYILSLCFSLSDKNCA
jgi:hypothetical protein